MVCVGIDVAKDKHDCCILDSDGTIRADCITIPNNMDGFKQLLQTIRDCTKKSDKIKVGLEATGHYSYNILGFLLDNDLAVYVMNPLHTNLYRKSLSLRKTKTDRVDARTIATMVGVQLHKAAAHHLGRLVVPGDVQHLAVGGTGIHQQIHDLVEGIFIIRAEPEKKVYLQRT